MDENNQEKTSNNPVTAENKLWLPASYTNGNAPITAGKASGQRKTGNRWGVSGKTGWDWLNLIGVLAIPFVIAAGTLFITQQITLQQAQLSEKQHLTDVQIAQDQQRETKLESYIVNMQDLLLNKNLRESNSNGEVRVIARAQTLSVIGGLDSKRKGVLLQFLYEAQLINSKNAIISLQGTDLGGVELTTSKAPPNPGDINMYYVSRFDINLKGINISGANLSGSNFEADNLSFSDLDHAVLVEANLLAANLSNTNLSDVTMSRANLGFANLSSAHLSNTSLFFADLYGANLINATLSKAGLTEADLSHAKLNDADLSNAALERANLQNTDLRNTNLRNAFLYRADLLNANLQGADLSGVNLSYANLRGAIITQEQLNQAASLKGATMPDGTVHL